MIVVNHFSGKKVLCGISSEEDRLEDLLFIKELIENQKMLPVVDRHYSLENITEAHRYVETGHKVGSVIITL